MQASVKTPNFSKTLVAALRQTTSAVCDCEAWARQIYLYTQCPRRADLCHARQQNESHTHSACKPRNQLRSTATFASRACTDMQPSLGMCVAATFFATISLQTFHKLRTQSVATRCASCGEQTDFTLSGCTAVATHRKAEEACASVGSLFKARAIEYADASLVTSFTNCLRATSTPLHGIATKAQQRLKQDHVTTA